MIIDIHTHTFPDKIANRAVNSLSNKAHIVPHLEGTIDALISSMTDAGVDVSVVMPVATSAEQVVKINDSSIKNNEKYFDTASEKKVLSFGCMHPEFKDFRYELKRLSENGIKGIKIHPVYQECDIDDVKFLRIIDCAAENDLIVLTHAGLDVGFPGVVHCSPRMCRNVIEKIGDFKFVLAHMGGWENWEEVPDTFAGTCAYIDTSFSSEELEPLSDGYW
ncbi:MAG: amidohydrolase family protein, partial [Butyrivibrio sp.]|nr:amidohydrolase family protein [Butyrivibrio sp.]